MSHDSISVGYLEKSNSETESGIGMTVECSKKGQRESVFNGYRVSVLQDEEFWRGMVVLAAPQWVRISWH